MKHISSSECITLGTQKIQDPFIFVPIKLHCALMHPLYYFTLSSARPFYLSRGRHWGSMEIPSCSIISSVFKNYSSRYFIKLFNFIGRAKSKAGQAKTVTRTVNTKDLTSNSTSQSKQLMNYFIIMDHIYCWHWWIDHLIAI
jgi:hypothetical protein